MSSKTNKYLNLRPKHRFLSKSLNPSDFHWVHRHLLPRRLVFLQIRATTDLPGFFSYPHPFCSNLIFMIFFYGWENRRNVRSSDRCITSVSIFIYSLVGLRFKYFCTGTQDWMSWLSRLFYSFSSELRFWRSDGDSNSLVLLELVYDGSIYFQCFCIGSTSF